MKIVGLMSGTSADGVDAALVEWPDTPDVRPFRLVAYRERPFEPALQERIHRLAAGRVDPGESLAELAALDVALAERFADAALEVVAEAGLAPDAVSAIASHGQTVGHFPERHATLQIGDPSLIAERSGWTTVADFRARDMAAGGEGAPLAPFFHHAVFASNREDRIVLNLGGIANLSWLPRGGGPDEVIAFDVGPANVWLDEATRIWTDGGERIDSDGRRAAAGTVHPGLLAALLDDEFLATPPPKSTGRERYGPREAEGLVAEARRARISLDDLLATLVAFTAEAVVRAVRDFLPEPARVSRLLMGGGGTENRALRGALEARHGGGLDRFDAHGVPSHAAEAMAFSLFGRNALLGVPNHLPRCTGANRACVLGEIVAGRSGLRPDR